MMDKLSIALLGALTDPAFLLDSDRRVQAANEKAKITFSGLQEGQDLILAIRHPAALDAVNDVLAGASEAKTQITQTVPVNQVFEMHVAALADHGEIKAFCMLRDLTTEKEAERMRADFVANVSHELRSPLSSLVGFVETLRGPARNDSDAQARFLAVMDAEAKRMTRLVEDLLSLSRVEAGEHVPPSGTVELTTILSAIRNSMQERAGLKGKILLFTMDDDLPPLPGDPDELTEVFHNLIDNAVKYGFEDTPVLVTVVQGIRIPDVGEVGVSVAVANQGELIEPRHLPRLTERFYRIDKGRSRDMGGTGLGLAIVKHMISHHRGRLTIESSAEQGNVFTVFLPL